MPRLHFDEVAKRTYVSRSKMLCLIWHTKHLKTSGRASVMQFNAGQLYVKFIL